MKGKEGEYPSPSDESPSLVKTKIALQTAIITRTCPPDRILARLKKGKGGSYKTLKRHVDSCFYCQGRVEMVDEAKVTGHREFGESTLGAVVALKVELGGWQGKEYMNPPIGVLLKRIPEATPRAWRFIQTYWDKTLMGPEDIFLGEGIGFAEPWNTYAIPEEFIDRVYGKVEKEVLERCMAAIKGPFHKIEQDSPLYLFRTMELRVGHYFARKGLNKLIQSPRVLDLLTLKKILKASFPNCDLPKGIKDPYELLARTKFEEYELPLAASGEEGWEEVKIFTILSHRIELRIGLFKITYQNIQEKGVVLGGVLRGPISEGTSLKAWWVYREKWIRAIEEELDYNTRSFRLLFRKIENVEFLKGHASLILVEY